LNSGVIFRVMEFLDLLEFEMIGFLHHSSVKFFSFVFKIHDSISEKLRGCFNRKYKRQK